MLRHTLATLAYRAGKVLHDAPADFHAFKPAEGSRTAGQILAHMGDLMDWSVSIVEGKQTWNDSVPQAWDADGRRFFDGPARFADPSRRAKLEKAFPEIDKLFQNYAAGAHVPGAAWGIIIDGELAHTGVTGYRDLPSKAPVTPDSVFRIASMTKSFTAIAILKLRDEGKLSLEDPAEKYVPEMKALVYPTSDAPKITIRHLLSHAEGFPEDNPWGDQQLADTDKQLSAMISAGIPFSNAPGVAYEYSNFGFAILGRLVANVADPSATPPVHAFKSY